MGKEDSNLFQLVLTKRLDGNSIQINRLSHYINALAVPYIYIYIFFFFFFEKVVIP